MTKGRIGLPRKASSSWTTVRTSGSTSPPS